MGKASSQLKHVLKTVSSSPMSEHPSSRPYIQNIFRQYATIASTPSKKTLATLTAQLVTNSNVSIFIENNTNEPFLAVIRVVFLHADGRLGQFQVQEFAGICANDANSYKNNVQECTTQLAEQIRFETTSSLNVTTIEKLFSVSRTNAHGLYFSEGARIGSQVLPLMSRSDHACNANTGLQVTKGSPSLDVVALRDIEAGEELTVNYVSGDMGMSERKQKLKETGFFDCRCVKCRLEEAELAQKAQDAVGRRSCSCCLDCT